MAKYGYYGAEHHVEVKNKTYKGKKAFFASFVGEG